MDKLVLIVDDDRTERRMAAGILKSSLSLNSIEAEDGRDALRILDKDDDKKISLVILDLEMPTMGGMDALETINKKHPGVPVIVLTGSTELDDAVKAMHIGAADFLSKPIQGARLDASARNVLKLSLMSQEISRLKRKVTSSLSFSDLIGYDSGLAESIATGQKAAACDLPVLITGETGTGKEMFAAAIHGEGRRVGQPFIAVNCGAIPEKLVESTLFGHEKGAFTGAVSKSPGKFQEASGGTIFLDEIGELPLEAQVKLLRALQQKEVEPVGGKPVPVDVRVISATNRDLTEEVKHKRFREDLFFRLNVLHIDLPPLRERKQDIPAISKHFIKQFCATNHTFSKELSGDSMLRLQSHLWPGNVRELENVINRAMAMHDEHRLEPDHFSFMHTVIPAPALGMKNAIIPLHEDGTLKNFKELEEEIIACALAHHHNNISAAARALGIAKSTFYTKLGNMADRKRA